MAEASVNEGLWRIGGMHGSVWRDGKKRAEVVEINAAIEVNRIEVPLVGQTKQGYKPGRESREGSFRIQKIDTYWEQEIYKFLSTNLRERRRNRATATPTLKPFQLQI